MFEAHTYLPVDNVTNRPRAAVECDSFNQPTFRPNCAKLPPLNLYWNENQNTRSDMQNVESLADDDVFNNIYAILPGIDSSLASGDRASKDSHYDFLIDDLSSPLYSESHQFPAFYSTNLAGGAEAISPTCTESTSRSFSPSETDSPFLTSPSHYHQTFQFPPTLNENPHGSESGWTGDAAVDDNSPCLDSLACRWVDCKATFDSQEDLVQHIERSHVDQRRAEDFTCFWAGCPRRHRPFNARYKLLIHMRVHSGEKPNRCSVTH